MLNTDMNSSPLPPEQRRAKISSLIPNESNPNPTVLPKDVRGAIHQPPAATPPLERCDMCRENGCIPDGCETCSGCGG